MPIFLSVRQVAVCTICQGQFDLEPEEKPPDRCVLCGSSEWEWGPDSKESRLIRQEIMRFRKPINPGVTSKKRQDHGRRQYRQFKPKEGA